MLNRIPALHPLPATLWSGDLRLDLAGKYQALTHLTPEEPGFWTAEGGKDLAAANLGSSGQLTERIPAQSTRSGLGGTECMCKEGPSIPSLGLQQLLFVAVLGPRLDS